MKVYLHVGTEKTGSSYLQKLCANNRVHLRVNGYAFPTAGRDEQRLRAGTISPGNARELAELIEDGAWGAVEEWMRDRIKKARRENCNRMLLSHELLFAALAHAGHVSRLVRAVARAGAHGCAMLLVVRDPVDHAVSLYKHRAKHGAVTDLPVWIAEDYRTPEELKQFLLQSDTDRVQLSVRRYTSDGALLRRRFFMDWLGVEEPPLSIESTVNPSLGLSELQFLRHLASSRPRDVPLFYEKMLSVPREAKASDLHLEEAARVGAAKHLASHMELWRDLQVRLRKDGGLDLPADSNVPPPPESSFCFSGAQLIALAVAHSETASSRYQARSFRRELRRNLGRARLRTQSWLKDQLFPD